MNSHYTTLCLAFISSLSFAAPGFLSRNSDLTQDQARYEVANTVNSFFGSNLYSGASVIIKNSENSIESIGHYAAGGKVYSRSTVQQETYKIIKRRIVSDVKDEARKIVNQTNLSGSVRDTLVLEAGNIAEAELTEIIARNPENGYSKFLDGKRTLNQKARVILIGE